MVDVAAPAPAGPARGPELPSLLPGALLGDGDGRRSTRDVGVDVVAFLLSIGSGLALFLTASDVRTAPRPLLAADLVTGLLLCVGLWWRRQYPVQLAVVAALLGTFSAMSGGAGVVALFTLAVHRRAAVVLGVAALGLACGVPYELLREAGDTLPLAASVLFILLITLVVTGWGMLVRARRQLVESLRDRARRAEAEQQLRVEQARQTERTRIAREMHDVLAHRISLVSLHAGALEYRADASTPPSAAEVTRAAAVIRESAHAALQDLRDILGLLRAPGDDQPQGERPVPTLADLPRLVAESRQAGMRVEFTTLLPDDAPDGAQPPAAAGRTAYRVVQEALTNARKHAPGASVAVAVSGGPGEGLTVEVRNVRLVGGGPGGGIPGSGSGLAGLAERAAVAGGRLEYGPDRGPGRDGWRVRAWLPWLQ